MHTLNTLYTITANAAWYQAVTLAERAALSQNTAYQCSSDQVPNSEIAAQKLRRWKDQAPFHKNTYFAQRLATDALSENDLLALLAQPIDLIQACFATPPGWLQALIAAYAHEQGDPPVHLPLEKITDPNTLAFLTILRPLLQPGAARLQTGIQQLVHSYERLPFDPGTLSSLFFAHLPKLLLPKLTRVVVLELHVARLQERLQGETPEQRFLHFLQQHAQPGGMLPIFEEYPVLARQLVETTDQWVSCILEFLERLCADWKLICATFSPESDPGVLVDVQEGAGDTHRGGRSVITLTWSAGFRLVYKPRSLAIDAHFQELLLWLNTRGFQPPFRPLVLLDKKTYGWCEFVEAAGCGLTEEVTRFYERQGGYLALLYALEATDFHAENVIASGEHPMLIDLEALFHPHAERAGQQEYSFLDTIAQSVLRVGFLPQRLWSSDKAAGIDISGLGGEAGQLTPMPVALWKEKGTDQMRLSRERVALSLGKHRPTLDGHEVNTLEYSEALICGFTTLYRLLIQHREELLDSMLPRFAHDEIRCLLRPSNTYATILTDSFHPNALRDALDRDRVFDRLWIGVEQLPYLAKIIPAERADMLRGDIPIFTTHPASCDLTTTSGAIIPAFFSEPGLELVRKRMWALDMQDMERQIWVIQAAFTSLELGTDTTPQSVLRLQPSQSSMAYERLIMMARSIGDRLLHLAMYSDDAVGWLGVSPVNEREWHLLPAGLDLYGGLPGIAFFLGYLGMVTGEERYTTTARLALQTARSQVGRQKRYACIGAFEGIGGYLYLLAHMGQLWQEPALYREAEEIIKRLPATIETDELFDLLSGAAGCIASLLSVYAVAPSDLTLTTAIQCGQHLVAHARPMECGIGWSSRHEAHALTGLSHGNAGMALSLLCLNAISGEEAFHQAALAALAYERSVFSPERCNWPDLRTSQAHHATQAYMAAWCHGAPGIGLARLASLRYIDDATIRSEINAAIQTTLAHGFGRNHSLCHGDLGNIEVLLMAAQLLADPSCDEHLQRIVPMLLDSIDVQGWCSGIPLGVETPGLMTGLAGTGYALLRLAAPQRIPSLLLLEPPR